jgi:hypothetical protein
MKKYTVFHSVTAAPAAANSKVKRSGSLLKMDLTSIGRNSSWWLSTTTLRRPRRSDLLPRNSCPGVEARLREGFEVHVVYEACGLGYGLYRALLQAGAYCYVIAPQKLDEGNTRVKTDGRDSHALCLRLDRYLAGNKNSLAVIRVPSEEEERPGTGAVSVNSLSVTDRRWRLKAANCLLAMGYQRPRAGGGRRVGAAWASFCRFGYSPTLSSISRCSSASINKSARLLSS